MHPCLLNLKPGDVIEWKGLFGDKYSLPFVRFESGVIMVKIMQHRSLVDAQLNTTATRNLKIIKAKAKCIPASKT